MEILSGYLIFCVDIPRLRVAVLFYPRIIINLHSDWRFNGTCIAGDCILWDDIMKYFVFAL